MKVTDKQRALLEVLGAYTNPPSSRQLADRSDRPRAYSRTHSRDEVHASLRRLEKRGLVTRTGERPVRWVLTDDGRRLIA